TGLRFRLNRGIALSLIVTNDVRRSIQALEVGDHDKVDNCRKMIVDICLDDIFLVADDEREHELHQAAFRLRAWDGMSRKILARPGRCQPATIPVHEPTVVRHDVRSAPKSAALRRPHGRRLTPGQGSRMVRPMNEAVTPVPNSLVTIGAARFGNGLPLALIAGPCALESRAHALEMASALKEIASRLKLGLIYKSSFDKANRTSSSSARGLGLKAALSIFAELRESVGLPVITDVHEPDQCAALAEAVDALQIPAFLCRQTDLLLAAAANGNAVKVRKGQLRAP